MKDRAYVPYAFLFPALLGILIFKLLPIAEGLKESLYASSFLAGEKIFTGLKKLWGSSN